MLAHGARQRQRLRLRIGIERVIADGVGCFTGRLLRRKREGVSLHHHEGVHATVAPTRRPVQRMHAKALSLPGGESTMTFLALRMAAQGHRRGRDVLALREQERLGVFDLDDLLATRLMNVGRGFGIAVMRIQGPLVRLQLGSLSHVAHHRNCTGFAALHGGVSQEGPGGMTDRKDYGLLVPRGQRPSQDLPIYGDPGVRCPPLHLHAKMLVDQRVQLHPVHARQESREVGARDHPGRRVLRDLAQPLNPVTKRAKDA